MSLWNLILEIEWLEFGKQSKHPHLHWWGWYKKWGTTWAWFAKDPCQIHLDCPKRSRLSCNSEEDGSKKSFQVGKLPVNLTHLALRTSKTISEKVKEDGGGGYSGLGNKFNDSLEIVEKHAIRTRTTDHSKLRRHLQSKAAAYLQYSGQRQVSPCHH